VYRYERERACVCVYDARIIIAYYVVYKEKVGIFGFIKIVLRDACASALIIIVIMTTTTTTTSGLRI
jgi:hypothetical protein